MNNNNYFLEFDMHGLKSKNCQLFFATSLLLKAAAAQLILRRTCIQSIPFTHRATPQHVGKSQSPFTSPLIGLFRKGLGPRRGQGRCLPFSLVRSLNRIFSHSLQRRSRHLPHHLRPHPETRNLAVNMQKRKRKRRHLRVFQI